MSESVGTGPLRATREKLSQWGFVMASGFQSVLVSGA